MNFNPLRPCGRRPPADPGIDWNHQHFNPLRPCGRRLSKQIIHEGSRRFQSTPPVWAETSMTASTRSNTLNFNPLRPCGRRPIARPPPAYQCRISIHSARVGGDPTNAGKTAPDQTFQSTPPVWAETGKRDFLPPTPAFQSTPPVWAETFVQKLGCKNTQFQSTPPVWAETTS